MTRTIGRSLLTCLSLSVAAPGFPLDSMLARGDSCLAVEWTPDSLQTAPDWYIKNGSRCTGSDTIYLHSDFIAGETYRSVAYSYGGEDPHDLFRSKVTAGFFVGSHLCHYLTFNDPSPAIAGTDCSGFACHVWNVARVSTARLAADHRYRRIPFSALTAGDLLVKPSSHAVIVVEKDDSTRFLIRESTSAVNGCRERIIDLSDSYWDSYIGLRNDSLAPVSKQPRDRRGTTRPRFQRTAEGTIAITFHRPFSGTVGLADARGRRIATIPVNASPGTVSYALPIGLAPGIYPVSLTDDRGRRDHTVLLLRP